MPLKQCGYRLLNRRREHRRLMFYVIQAYWPRLALTAYVLLAAKLWPIADRDYPYFCKNISFFIQLSVLLQKHYFYWIIRTFRKHHHSSVELSVLFKTNIIFRLSSETGEHDCFQFYFHRCCPLQIQS